MGGGEEKRRSKEEGRKTGMGDNVTYNDVLNSDWRTVL